MTIQQKQLLYEITELHVDQFYLAMNDHWSREDYTKDNEYTKKINELEKQYKDIYQELPEWKTIDDVFATRNELRENLTD